MTTEPEPLEPPPLPFPTIAPPRSPEAYRELLRILSSSGDRLPCQDYPSGWTADDDDDEFNELAVSGCLGCRHLGPCRQYALDAGEPSGVWGGTTARDRRPRASDD